MKRAEWFVTQGRGHWAKAIKPFVCDFNTPCGPCRNETAKGELYLATDLPKYPYAPAHDRAKAHMKRRFCFACAEAEITINSTLHIVD